MNQQDRDLIQRLSDALAEWQLGGAPPEDTADADLIAAARARLAQPAPPPAPADLSHLSEAEFNALAPQGFHGVGGEPVSEWPADEEIDLDATFYKHASRQDQNFQPLMDVQDFSEACATLARYGHQSPAPIPLSERQPTEADCDADGRCWLHHVTGLGITEWHFLDRYPSAESYAFYGYTHWLPHWALPVPDTTNPAQ